MPVNIKNCTVALTNAEGIEIIPAGSVPNANMQFESGPTTNELNNDLSDIRIMYCVRVNNPGPTAVSWPTPGDILTVSAHPSEPRNVGDWEIVRMEPGGFSTLLLFVKAAIQLEP